MKSVYLVFSVLSIIEKNIRKVTLTAIFDLNLHVVKGEFRFDC